MRAVIHKLLLLLAIFSFFVVTDAHAQKAPKCVKVAKSHRPNWLRIDTQKLNRFYQNFDDKATFSNMKVVKSELAYYLLAREKEGTRIFAFELEQKGKRLFLNKFYPVQTCDEGEFSLDTFLQVDGKIQGCRLGTHTIRQITKGE